MKLVNRGLLIDFMKKYSDAKGWIDNWISDVEASKWQRPQDIKNRYSTASIISNPTVIFNVKGNKYRLEVDIAYQTGVVFVKFIETHAQYTRRHKKGK